MTWTDENRGAAWLDLLGTLRGRYRTHQDEDLQTAEDLSRFLDAQGLAPARRPEAADVATTREIRETLHAITRAVHDGTPIPAPMLRALAELLAQEDAVAVRTRRGPLVALPPATTTQALARIARGMVDDLTGPRRAQLHACGDETCAGFFLDPSGRRQWCSSTRCGSRVRVRRHRAQQRGARE